MLTREENEMITRVGPGTPAGELLRRYWFPVGVASELTAESPTQIVRILGETLVLFRDKKGNVGLLNDRCSHRGASLCYGRVEERGIACPYHGWLYDTKGNCLETPAEPAESKFHLTVKQKSYPVQKLVGLYWAYLGPQPLPLIPNFDVWFERMVTEKSSFNRNSTAIGFKRWRIPWIRRICRFSIRIRPIAAGRFKTARADSRMTFKNSTFTRSLMDS